MAKPIEFGELGIIELERFIRALQLRWLWFYWSNLKRPWHGTEMPVNADDLAVFKAATVVTIRNGCKASFWHSSWLDGQPPGQPMPGAVHKHSKRKNRTVREALLNLKWVCDVAYNLNHELLDEYFRLWSAIERVGFDRNATDEDTITWTLESSWEYSAKSAYTIQFAGQITSSHPILIRRVWAPLKCRFFTWLLLQNRLWTAARLQLRGWENNYFCALYERSLETAQHLFFKCPVSREVWQLVASWSGCNRLNPNSWAEAQDVEDWYIQAFGPQDRKGKRCSF